MSEAPRRFIEWSAFDKASHIWAYIEDPTMVCLKVDIRDDLNKHNFYSYNTAQYFNPNVRRYLKALAGRKNLVLVNENGYIFTSTDEAWAFRVVIRTLRYGTTMGLNLNDPGSGVSLLSESSVPLYQDIAEKAELYGLLARQLRRGLKEADVAIKEQDKVARAKAKALLYNP
jgi:hypothetical protein